MSKPTILVIVDRLDNSLIAGTNDRKIAQGFIREQGMEDRYCVRFRAEWERK